MAGPGTHPAFRESAAPAPHEHRRWLPPHPTLPDRGCAQESVDVPLPVADTAAGEHRGTERWESESGAKGVSQLTALCMVNALAFLKYVVVDVLLMDFLHFEAVEAELAFHDSKSWTDESQRRWEVWSVLSTLGCLAWMLYMVSTLITWKALKTSTRDLVVRIGIVILSILHIGSVLAVCWITNPFPRMDFTGYLLFWLSVLLPVAACAALVCRGQDTPDVPDEEIALLTDSKASSKRHGNRMKGAMSGRGPKSNAAWSDRIPVTCAASCSTVG